MSIIEEALRRREQERTTTGAASGPMLPPVQEAPSPAAPPPRPPPLPTGKSRTSPAWRVLVLCLLVVAFGFALVYALSSVGIRLWRGPKGTTAVQTPEEDARPGPWSRVFGSVAATLSNAVARSTETDAVSAPPADETAPPDEGEFVAAVPPPPPPPPTPEAAVAEAGPASPGIAPPRADVAAEAEIGVVGTIKGVLGAAGEAGTKGKPAVPSADVKWPEVTLKGVLASSRPGASSALFADGAIVGVGEAHMGMRVIEVRKDDIVVEKQGTRRTMRCGQSLP